MVAWGPQQSRTFDRFVIAVLSTAGPGSSGSEERAARVLTCHDCVLTRNSITGLANRFAAGHKVAIAQ